MAFDDGVKLFGDNGRISHPTKLFGPDGTISHPRQLLGPDGQPFRRDAPDAMFQVKHAVTFSSMLSTGYKAYLHGQQDASIRHSREDAIAMRNDPFLMAILNERKFGTVSLPWDLEIDDERDQMEIAVRDTLTRIVRDIPRFRRLCMYMMEAVWYGRYASEIVWKWAVGKFPSATRPGQRDEMRYLTVQTHQPINGDKIGHHWDGTPYILVNPAFDRQSIRDSRMSAEIKPTSAGADGLYLRGHWREHFIVHTHEAVDADYFDPMSADAVHGLGVRSALFWLDWIRKEWLGNIADWCERTGLGIRLWYFQAGNPKSEAAVKKAALESGDRTNIFIPRYGTQGAGNEGVEYVDTSGTGAELLLKLQKHVEEQEERLMIGQSMSGGREGGAEGGGIGDEGKSQVLRETKAQIIAYDAWNLGETLTTDLLKPIQKWTYRRNPDAQKVNVRLVFSTEQHEPDKFATAVEKVVSLGLNLRADAVRTALGKGFEKPQMGDEEISMETINKAKQAGMPAPQPGMPGMPGAMPPGMPQPGGAEEPGEEGQEPEPGAEDVQAQEPQEEDVNAKLNEMLQRMGKLEESIKYEAKLEDVRRGQVDVAEVLRYVKKIETDMKAVPAPDDSSNREVVGKLGELVERMQRLEKPVEREPENGALLKRFEAFMSAMEEAVR